MAGKNHVATVSIDGLFCGSGMVYTIYMDVVLSMTCKNSEPCPFEVVNNVKPFVVFALFAIAPGACRPAATKMSAVIKNAVAQRMVFPFFESVFVVVCI